MFFGFYPGTGLPPEWSPSAIYNELARLSHGEDRRLYQLQARTAGAAPKVSSYIKTGHKTRPPTFYPVKEP